MIAVGFETITGPIWQACGGFEWTVRFYITEVKGVAVAPLARSKDSWVVQHIKNSGQANPCGDGDVQDLMWEYYEAFCIGTDGKAKKDWDYKESGGLIGQVTGNDTDQLSRGPYPRTWGHWTIEAHAYWLDVQPTGLKVNNLQLMGYVGGLPASTTAPPELAPMAEPTLIREVETRWNCCDTTRGNDPPGFLSGRVSANNKWNTYQEAWTLKSDGTVRNEKTVDGVSVK